MGGNPSEPHSHSSEATVEGGVKENTKQLKPLHGLKKSKPLFLRCRLLTITPAKFQESF